MNHKLLSRPDLTNQFAGVLIRFYTEEVACMNDIEIMCYQVQVPEEQRRFLRWGDCKLRGDLLHHKMCACF